MSRRRLRRKSARAQRRVKASPAAIAARPDPLGLEEEWFRSEPVPIENPTRVVVREARQVERLAYTRAQAAQALGMGRSMFARRVLPYVEILETPWGTKLIPVDELERLLTEWRRPARPRPIPRRAGRPQAVAPDVVERIRAARDAGMSLRQIAEGLNADGTPTARGGVRWWPSTVRSVLGR
jgi:hypothetical protein